MQHSGIAQPGKHAHTWTNGLASIWLPVTKSLCFRSPQQICTAWQWAKSQTKKEQSQQWLQKPAFLKWDCLDFLTMRMNLFSSWKKTFLKKTQTFSRKTFILFLPHIQTNSSPLHQKCYVKWFYFMHSMFWNWNHSFVYAMRVKIHNNNRPQG